MQKPSSNEKSFIDKIDKLILKNYDLLTIKEYLERIIEGRTGIYRT
jgi:hypothetical protein